MFVTLTSVVRSVRRQRYQPPPQRWNRRTRTPDDHTNHS